MSMRIWLQTSGRRRVAAAVALATGLAGAGSASPATAAPILGELQNVVALVEDGDHDGLPRVVAVDLLSRVTIEVFPESASPRLGYGGAALSQDRTRVAVSRRTTDDSMSSARIVVAQITGSSPEEVTSPQMGARDFAPAWSPDGNRIVFVRQAGEEFALHIVDLRDRSVVRVPNTDGAVSADWEPTGGRIVFARRPTSGAQDGEILVVAPDGTGLRSVGVTGRSPTWDPRGDLIAFSFTESTDPNSFVPNGRAVRLIATVPVEGGPTQTYPGTRPTEARTAAEHPRWAPDGLSLLFDLHGYGLDDNHTPSQLWAIDRSGVRSGIVLFPPSELGDVAGPALPDVVPSAASGFHPVRPARVLDTRSGLGAGAAAPVRAQEPLRLQLTGVTTSAGSVPTSASAVALTVTVTEPTNATDVRVYPTGTAVPNVSNINARAGATVPNLVIVRLGDDGSVSLQINAGMAHLVADIAGYFTPGPDGLGMTAIRSTRIYDSRPDLNPQNVQKGAVGPEQSVDVDVTGTFSSDAATTVQVPDSARAVVVNLTGTEPTAGTVVRAYPASAEAAVPVVSNLNLGRGQTAAGLAIVAVGEDGRIRLHNSSGSVHLVVDLVGYVDTSSTSRFVPVAPARFLDTRAGVGAAPIKTRAGVNSLKLNVGGHRGVPAGATGAWFNLTGTEPEVGTHFTVFVPAGKVAPNVSSLNLGRAETRANLVLTTLDAAGSARIANRAGSAHMIADVAGYLLG